MKKIPVFIFSLFVLMQMQAQTSNIDTITARKTLFVSAQKMGTYFVNKQYNQYVKLVHPRLVKLMGGETKFMEVLKQGLKQTEEEGFVFSNVSIGDPLAIIITPTELQCVVPQMLELQVNKGGRLVSTSYLIAISSDEGKTWYFIDTAGKDLKQMQSAFPSLSNKLVIPDKTQPVFYNN